MKITNRGIYRKFNVTRTDGSSEPGGKHEHCKYFVLDLEHDPFAKPALRKYAEACRETHPDLARDLESMSVTGKISEHEMLVTLANMALRMDDLTGHDVIEALKGLGYGDVVVEARNQPLEKRYACPGDCKP